MLFYCLDGCALQRTDAYPRGVVQPNADVHSGE
jgi:hypothetical protein